MKILTIGNFGHGWDGSICDEEHIASALEWEGHEVVRAQREQVMYPEGEYDFTLIAQWDGYSDEVLRSLPRPLVYWAFDYQDQGQGWHINLVSAADLYLSKRLADSRFANWQWLAQDFAPEFLRGHSGKYEQDIDVLFTGSYLPWAHARIETLRAVDQRFNLVIHSVTPDQWKAEGFKNVNGPVMDEGLPDLIHRAKINLSIDHTIEAGYWSDRNAQTMVCEALVLFKYVPLSEAVFRDNILYFHDTQQCLDLIEEWVRPEMDQIRRGFAEKARIFAAYNLMVRNRVKDLLIIVGGIL